jgi:hypothetical protein
MIALANTVWGRRPPKPALSEAEGSGRAKLDNDENHRAVFSDSPTRRLTWNTILPFLASTTM